MWTHLIHPSLNRPHSLPKTIARSIHALLHNYATKSTLVTIGCPKFTTRTAPKNDRWIGDRSVRRVLIVVTLIESNELIMLNANKCIFECNFVFQQDSAKLSQQLAEVWLQSNTVFERKRCNFCILPFCQVVQKH